MGIPFTFLLKDELEAKGIHNLVTEKCIFFPADDESSMSGIFFCTMMEME